MTVLTLEYIKQATGEFDPETIFQAILSRRSIKRIDVVSQCCNLRWLDLSRNEIYRLENLEGLCQLVSMDVSFNKLSKVQCLESLTKLERMNLRSNPIARLQDIEGLAVVKKLKHVNFQNIDGTDFCPVCMQPGYRRAVFEMCPDLMALDSRRKHLPDLDLEVRRLDDEPKIELPEPEPWFNRSDLDFDDVQDPEAVAATLEPQVAEFEAALSDCAAALREAEELLKNVGDPGPTELD
eukprot:TRINITY_DN62639_c0_g1_i1.p1 TRINITY_DN62639_c0_g1~~TRINITY_DN62639_c0_g1_i1.p1  ORF type:complete len:238 (+),score=57.31 TRINITY_DN62639_c0_g1_i1:173-886(+)